MCVHACVREWVRTYVRVAMRGFDRFTAHFFKPAPGGGGRYKGRIVS